MYSPDDPRYERHQRKEEIQIKKKIIEAFNDLRIATTEENITQLEHIIDINKSILEKLE